MKMRSLMLDAGSIILWKEYNPIRKLWSKVRRKTLPFNRFTIVGQKTELLITFGLGSSKEWDEVVTIINIVRPNTLLATSSIDKCKYYKRVEWNEKLDEYIY